MTVPDWYKMLRNPIVIFIFGVVITTCSIYEDWGRESWQWFQRSGSLLVLLGAILELRSVLRLGVNGVGGTNTSILMGKVNSVDESSPNRKLGIKYDEETEEFLYQAAMDKLSGYIGAIFLIFGTVIWGYGDLLGKIF